MVQRFLFLLPPLPPLHPDLVSLFLAFSLSLSLFFFFGLFGIHFLRFIWRWPETDIDLKPSWIQGRKQYMKWGWHWLTSFVSVFKILSWLFPHAWLPFSLRFYKGYRWGCRYSLSHPAFGSGWGSCRPHDPFPPCVWWEHWRAVGSWWGERTGRQGSFLKDVLQFLVELWGLLQ